MNLIIMKPSWADLLLLAGRFRLSAEAEIAPAEPQYVKSITSSSYAAAIPFQGKNLKHSLLPSIGLLFLAANCNLSAMSEGASPEPWYVKSTTSSSYAAATAHEPNYTNKELWPEEVQKAAFIKQAWPKARVLVWAQPEGKEFKDGFEAKYWLEDGKPATTPFDENTDLIFPDRSEDKIIWVSLGRGGKQQPANFRHLTVGRGFGAMGHFSAAGNTWIKKGGGVLFLDSCMGPQNTFLRNDNDDIRLVGHFHFRKTPPASCEIVGKFSSADNWQIDSGLMILSPDSEVGQGSRTDPFIHEDAAVALLSGSYLTRRTNCDWGDDLTVKGKLTAGLPDRPLTRNARLGLGSKSKGAFINSDKSFARISGPTDHGLIVAEGGSLIVYTADPAHARLVINWCRRENDWGQIEIQASGLGLDQQIVIEKIKAMPQLTDMLLLGDADLSNVLFDDIRKGGIQMSDPAKSKLWKNVSLGPNNGGKTLAELVSQNPTP